MRRLRRLRWPVWRWKLPAILMSTITVVALHGCRTAVGPAEASSETALTRDASPLFQTDSLGYTLRNGSLGYEASVTVIYTNRTASPTSFVNCDGGTNYTFEKLVSGQWAFAWSPGIAACLSPPIVVLPGATHTFILSVFGGYPDCRCAPQFAVTDISGVYRAVWGSGFNADDGSGGMTGGPVPLEARISNRFTLTAMSR